jgi:regulator of protease activity HflC (stomatin/prohibitin superfamily)
MKFDMNKKMVMGIVAAVIIIGLVIDAITFIQSHERGLRFTMGAISEEVLQPGVRITFPIFQNIKKISLRPTQIDNKIEVGPNGAITKDNQTIGSTNQIFFVYKEKLLVPMWKEYGKEKMTSLVISSIEESFKTTIGTYTIFEVPINQDKIRKDSYKDAKAKLAQYPIELTELRITNYDWSDEFDKQIAQTMEKAQQVKQKEQELAMKEFESQKIVKEAEANKTATIRAAEGEKEKTKLEAEAKILRGEGIRKFNESIRATQEIEIKLRELEIEFERVKKWNGQYVPNNNYGPIPFQTGSTQGMVK